MRILEAVEMTGVRFANGPGNHKSRAPSGDGATCGLHDCRRCTIWAHMTLESDGNEDWDAWRRRTPAAGAFVHLNHASTSLPDDSVFVAQRCYLECEARIGAHRAAAAFAQSIDAVPGQIAALIGCSPGNVALVESASKAYARALSAAAALGPVQVFASRDEWPANLMNASASSRVLLSVVEREPSQAWQEAFARALGHRDPSRVPVLSMPMLPSHGGEPHDLSGLSALAAAHGGWLFVDASQALGQVPVHLQSSGADALYFPARKWLRGPRGMAALALSDRALRGLGAPAFADIHGGEWDPSQPGGIRHDGSAARFQPYGLHPGLVLAFGAAAQVYGQAQHRVHRRLLDRARTLERALEEIPHVAVAQHGGSAMVCVTTPHPAEAAAAALWQQGVNVAAIGTRHAPLRPQPPDGTLRFSPHVFTTDEELDQAASALRRIVGP